jgi:hypothetical protein
VDNGLLLFFTKWAATLDVNNGLPSQFLFFRECPSQFLSYSLMVFHML